MTMGRAQCVSRVGNWSVTRIGAQPATGSVAVLEDGGGGGEEVAMAKNGLEAGRPESKVKPQLLIPGGALSL